MIGVLITELLN